MTTAEGHRRRILAAVTAGAGVIAAVGLAFLFRPGESLDADRSIAGSEASEAQRPVTLQTTAIESEQTTEEPLGSTLTGEEEPLGSTLTGEEEPREAEGDSIGDEGRWEPGVGYTRLEQRKSHERRLQERIREHLRNPLPDPHGWFVLSGLVWDLGHYNSDPGTLDLLVSLSRDHEKADVRSAAVSGFLMWRHEPRAWEALLEVATQDRDENVRASALVHLGSWAKPGHPMREPVIRALRHAIENDVDMVSAEAVRVLRYGLESPDCRDYLESRLRVEKREAVLEAIHYTLALLDKEAGRR